MVCVKFFEGFHGKGCYPYVGYGNQLQKARSLRQGLRSDKQTPSCVPTYGNALRCLRAMANKAKASYFARLSKGIGISIRNTYPFVTTEVGACMGYSDAGRLSLLYFISHKSSSTIIRNLDTLEKKRVQHLSSYCNMLPPLQKEDMMDDKSLL